MKKIFLSGIFLLLLGAGCIASGQPEIAEDQTPGANEENCLKSGGTVEGDVCACPEHYAPDPAGFCVDAQGRPGGELRP